MNLLQKLINNRILRYLFSGGSAVVTDLVALFVLEHYLHLWYLLSAVLAFILAVCVSFMLQKFFTFNDYTKDQLKKQMGLYLGLQLMNLGLNTLFMYLGVSILHVQYIVAQILISGVMAIYNFFIYRHLIFKPDSLILTNEQKTAILETSS